MLKINRADGRCERLLIRTLSEAKILERRDLQRMMVQDPAPFLLEMGEKLVIVGQEVKPSDTVNDSIDLLAVDEDGAAVIIELKRADQKLQLLQALSYAAMLADWEAGDFYQERARFRSEGFQEAQDAILDHLVSRTEENLNHQQRIILVAENYDYALLKTAEWLREKYNIAIRCYRIEYATDGGSELLSLTCVYPPLEIADHALRSRPPKPAATATRTFANWDAVLATIQNKAELEFFSKAIPNSVRRPGSRDIVILVEDVRRYYAMVRKNHCYVWQHGRFDGDDNFWRQGLSDPSSVEPVENRKNLRFKLRTESDFNFFEGSLNDRLCSIAFDDNVDNEPRGSGSEV